MIRILDAHGLMVFLEKEPGCKQVEEFLIEAVEKNAVLLMTTVNYGEVLYMMLRECGPERVKEIEQTIETMPIELVPVDVPLAREAARFKASKKMSYADCFAAALAKQREGEVITGDREFRAVEGEVKVAWV